MDNFIVSARKYRPATFMSVVGQSHITSTLKNAITRGQLAHAYLFCGPRGVGKTTCARIFAKAINCLSPKDGEACNECESCRAFNEGRSFSIHELDAASNNSVDDIRNLTDQVRIPPQIGRYSVYIIDEVHMLSAAAFNAFLKTLEEPPSHAVFILATTEKHKIIPTILSRCQIYDFNRIRVEDGVGYLKYIAGEEGIAFDEESLHIIAQKADGGMRDALSMFDKVVSFCGNNLTAKQVAESLNVLDYDTYFTVTQLILEGKYPEVLLLFDDVLRKGFGGQTFVGGLNGHMRNLLMCKDPQTISLLEVTGTVAQRYAEQARQCSVPLLFEAVNLLTAVDSGFRTATNQRLHVELGLMKLCGMGQKKNVADPTDESASPDNSVIHPTPVLPLPINAVSQDAATPAPATAPQAQPVATSTVSQPVAQAVQSIPPQQPVSAPATDAAPAIPHDNVIPVKASPSQRVYDTPAGTPDRRQIAAQPAAPTDKPQPTRTGSLAGFSLKEIMKSNTAQPEEEEETEEEVTEYVEADEEVEKKLEQACRTLAAELTERPRLATAFNGTTVSCNTVNLKVANLSLKDEVERNIFELKKRLAEIGDIRTPVEFKITVEKDNTVLRPVKPEDKLRFLSEQNSHLASFRKALDLDIE